MRSAVSAGSELHVFYFDLTSRELRHAMWNGGTWQCETVDGAGGGNGRVNGDLGPGLSALASHGRVHVFYADKSNGDVRHAELGDGQWQFEVLDGGGGAAGRTDADVASETSALEYGGVANVFYGDLDNGDLRQAQWAANGWAITTLDGAGGSGGRTNAAVGASASALVWGPQVRVWYGDRTNGDLRLATWTGATWLFQVADGGGGANGRTTADVATGSSSVIVERMAHVFYRDESNGDLRHLWYG